MTVYCIYVTGGAIWISYLGLTSVSTPVTLAVTPVTSITLVVILDTLGIYAV